MLRRSALVVPGRTSWRSQLSHSSNNPGRGATVANGREPFGRIGSARRGGHHQPRPRILEADAAAALWHLDIERARQDAVRVKVARVMPAAFQQIDPQAVELGLARQVERQLGRERGGVLGQKPGEVGEGGVAARQVVERSVAGIALIALVAAPAAPGTIVGRQRADAVRQLVEQRGIPSSASYSIVANRLRVMTVAASRRRS